ncbi:MAG TPA: ArsA family ATPase [Solirubrobacterales bacterium]|nr:ArsA family ATPase [Solirubrobacterales bacterium]
MKAPRTILYTGKGGVGKTSVAAATARRCAAAGLRTVVLSTDPAHSLSDSLEAELGGAPTPVAEGLWGQEVQAQREMERNWGAVQQWLGGLLADRGVMSIAAEELTVPPGMDELFSLLQIKRHHESGDYDVIVVDCAPTGETLRLLSFPDIARWWLEKVLPWEKRLVSAVRPIARTILDVPLPSEDVFYDVQRLVRNLIAMNEILRDREHASIRLVMNPDRMVVKEAQRTFTYLNLYGYLTDAVVVNRVFPDDVADGYFGSWRERQREQLDAVFEGFAPVPVLTARYFDAEVVGAEMLDRLGAELFAETAAHEVLHSELAHRLESEDGRTVLRLSIPFSDKGDIRLRKVGPELIVGVGREKRTIILPSALSERRPSGASFEGGTLKISFEDGRAARPKPQPGSVGGDEPPASGSGRRPRRRAGRQAQRA